MQFRQKALSKLQSSEELDLPVRFARPQGWLVLSVTVVVMAVASIWAVTGSVSSKLNVSGILTHGQGSYILQSPVSGQVTAVLVEQGAQLLAGAPLLKVRTAQGKHTVVRALAAGRVTTLDASIGAVVTMGADVAAIERVGGADSPLVAMLYVPATSAASVPVGASVDLTVESVPAQEYGTLRGTVKAVGRGPQTEEQIGSFLGDSDLARQFSQKGRPVAVLVRLAASDATKSGYAWSKPGGPPYRLDSMTLVGAAVHLAAQRPIDWLLP
jgi:hypothetical protein